MLTSLSIQNFKSWRDTGDIRLAPITAFFGTNSSGKTSILQLLLMLKQTCESPDRNQVLNLGGSERDLVDLGTFRELIFNHDLANRLSWNMAWTLGSAMRNRDAVSGERSGSPVDRLAFSATIDWLQQAKGPGRTIVNRMAYTSDIGEVGMRFMGMAEPPSTGQPIYEPLLSEEFASGIDRQISPLLAAPTRFYGFPTDVLAFGMNAGFLSSLEYEFEQRMSCIHYLGPLRDYPSRRYTWKGSQPADMGRRGEKTVEALIASRERGETISIGLGSPRQTLEQRVAYWLKELGLISRFRVKPLSHDSQVFQVMVRRATKSAEVPITDVGFGVSQILPVIALCYYVPEGSTLILEQPEIHLHPAVQSGLADVLIDAVERRGIQIILESHSEHLLRRLQRRIAENELSSENAALYFCQSKEGESSLTPLELDPFGNIRNWPPDFFGDQFGELAAAQKARIKRVAHQE